MKGNPFLKYEEVQNIEAINLLCGYSPDFITKIAAKALLFWENQRILKHKFMKNMICKKQKAAKELNEKYESEQLKNENERNSVFSKMNKFKSVAIKYKNGFPFNA